MQNPKESLKGNTHAVNEKEGFAGESEPQTSANIPYVISKHKTLSIEIAEQTTFTTESKLRIRRGHNITIRRCYEIGRFLLQLGYKNGDKLTRENLAAAVDKVPGMDQRTHNRYIGFNIYNRGNKVEPPTIQRKIKGYLERLRLIEPCGNGQFIFNAYLVPTAGEGSQHTIANLCAFSPQASSHIIGMEREPRETTTNNITTTTHNTHTNQSSESNLTPLEERILRVAQKEPFNPNLWEPGRFESREVPETESVYTRIDQTLANLRRAGKGRL